MSRTSFQIYETLRGDFYTALLRVSTNLTQGFPQQCGSQPPREVARWVLVPIGVTHTLTNKHIFSANKLLDYSFRSLIQIPLGIKLKIEILNYKSK